MRGRRPLGAAAVTYDLMIVGGGIVGLTQALAAAEAGRSVLVLDEHGGESPQGASARNFGMVWPIGLPLGPWHDLAVTSRSWWLSSASRLGFGANRSGSLFLAGGGGDRVGGRLEAAVMREFVSAQAMHRAGLNWLDREALRSRWPGLVDETTVGGLVCGEELGIDPGEALRALWAGLGEAGVKLRRGTFVERLCAGDDGGVSLHTAGGVTYRGRSALVCSGHAWQRFFPEAYAAAGVTTCKLQMLELEDLSAVRGVGGSAGVDTLPPMLATGLTLRHYPAFARCASLPALVDHVAATAPQLDSFGIHLLAAPRIDVRTGRRSWIVGDSHEYNADPFSLDERIGSAIAHGWAQRCPAMGSVQRRWLGFYAKQPGRYFFAQRFGDDACGPVACLHNVCGLGMTLSPGLAQATWADFEGDPVAAVSAMERRSAATLSA